MVFRVGLEDARLAAEKFGRTVSSEDLMGQESYRATVRVALPGWMPPPFTLWTDPPLEVPSATYAEDDSDKAPVAERQVGLPVEEPEPVITRAGRRRPDVDEE